MRSLLILLLLSACAYDNAPAPADSTAMTNKELCDHFSGEDPYDAERAAYLTKRMEDVCR